MRVLRVVVDTCVLTSAVRSASGASFAVVMGLVHGGFTGLASTTLMLEYEAVLKREEQMIASGMARDDVDALLARLASAVEPVVVHVTWRPQLRDPNDEFVLDAAINGRADAIVTHNLRDFDGASRFGIRVVSPSTILGETRR